jgi:hypothetical protein
MLMTSLLAANDAQLLVYEDKTARVFAKDGL